jgi:hypothetical protein
MLTDDTEMKPTRVNILKCLLDLITCGASNLYFHYSGHGAQVNDISGDEDDKFDECIVPLDFNISGMIVDDELRGLLQCLNETTRMTMVLDACHSGTGVDLCYNLYERLGRFSLLTDTKHKSSITRGKVVCISGCMDNSTSADAFEENTYQGALTYSLISSIRTLKGNKRTLENIYTSMRTILASKQYSQIPNISAGNNITKLTEIFTL